MKKSPPSVSVMMPVHNAADTLEECLDSLLRQDLPDFELVAINDQSSDASADIIHGYGDARFRVIDNPDKGMIPAMNLGLRHAQSDVVARMDADDIMHPHRLSAQFEYLNRHHNTTLVASQVRLFPEHEITDGMGEYIRWQNTCLTHDQIITDLYIESPLAHPSVMYRKDAILLTGGYREGLFPEDYDLWFRLIQRNHQIHKLPQVLLDWRESELRYTRTNPACSRAAFDRIRAHYLARDQRLHSTRPLVIWGAGRKSRQRASLLLRQGFTLSAWIDIDPKKIGNRINGIPVFDYGWLESRSPRPYVLIYVTNHGARQEIITALESMAYQAGEDYLAVG
jgi:glycosyltransferase involved in cell wall biosynthesis